MCTEMQKLQPNNSSPQVVCYSQVKWNVLFCLQQCLPSQFTWFFCLSVCLFLLLFIFFFHYYFTLFYSIIFLFFTAHIFVTLIKDYKIYLVAKRPQQGCWSFPNKEISHFPCFFFNRYFVSMNMLCKLFIGLHTRYL